MKLWTKKIYFPLDFLGKFLQLFYMQLIEDFLILWRYSSGIFFKKSLNIHSAWFQEIIPANLEEILLSIFFRIYHKMSIGMVTSGLFGIIFPEFLRQFFPISIFSEILLASCSESDIKSDSLFRYSFVNFLRNSQASSSCNPNRFLDNSFTFFQDFLKCSFYSFS